MGMLPILPPEPREILTYDKLQVGRQREACPVGLFQFELRVALLNERDEVCVHLEVGIDRPLQMEFDILDIEPVDPRVVIAKIEVVLVGEGRGREEAIQRDRKSTRL